MIPDEAWTLVPKDMPSEVEPWILGFAEPAKFDEREARAYIWAMHLLSRLSGQALTTAIMGVLPAGQIDGWRQVKDVTAGFIQLAATNQSTLGSLREARIEPTTPVVIVGVRRYTFGILVGIERPEGSEQSIDEEKQRPSQMVSIDDFPVIVEYRRITYTAPPNPIGATAACYAKPRASKRFWGPVWSDGIVIARHSLTSLGFTTGVSVPIVGAASYTVADIDSSTTIDAAILDCGSVPAHASALSLAPAVAPGTTVDVRGAALPFSAQVLTMNDHPKYFGNLFGHRVFLDQIGATGDSGSLVMRSPQGDSVGVYMGHTGGATPEGLAQSMRQVVNYFDVDLFD